MTDPSHSRPFEQASSLPTHPITVMFADLRGSTHLFESLGNQTATGLVTLTMDSLKRVVSRCQGRVIKTMGDGLMAFFEESDLAAHAADEFQDEIHRLGAQRPGGEAFSALKVQVGLARGDVVEVDGDGYGDALNVAARLLDLAGDQEILMTAAVFEGIDRGMKDRSVALGPHQLRGRSETVQVYRMESLMRLGVGETTFAVRIPTDPVDALTLTYEGLLLDFVGPQMPIKIGRSPNASLCIDDLRVSRSHARIDFFSGNFQITDLSFNGCFVQFEGSDETVNLRRGSCTLHGRGCVYLGASPAEPHAPRFHFEVLRLTDSDFITSDEDE